MSKQIHHLYEFDNFRLNVTERLLQHRGEDVSLPPKAFDLLLALVARHGQVVTKEELLNEIWPDSFVEETNLKVYVSTLRKVLSEGAEGTKFIETLPRRGYRFIGDITEVLPEPALDLIIEKKTLSRIVIEEHETAPTVTNPSSAPTIPALPPAPLSARRTRRVWIGALLIFLAIGGFAFYRWLTPPATIQSIAVLPFVTLPPTASDAEPLGIGLADALITRLSNTGSLIVRPTSAVLKLTAVDRDVVALGRKLGVDAVLDGHLQRSGEQIRLSVQLLRTADGKPLWAESFEEPNGGLFGLQRAVSERLAHSLTLRLTTDQQRKLKKDYTANAAAFEAYMRGRYFYTRQTKESFVKALEYFHQAIELDPSYALAWAGVADCYNAQSTTILSMGATPFLSFTAEARAAAERALALDDLLPEAHLSLAGALADTDHSKVHQEIDRAIVLNPNLAQAYNVYALDLIGDVRLDEALVNAERARKLDPLSVPINTVRGLVLYRLHRYDEAAAQFRRTLELDANFPRAYFGYGMVLEQQGHYDEAIAAYQKCLQLSGGGSVPLSALGHVYAISGRRAEAEQVLTRVLEQYKQNLAVPYYVSLVYAGLGDKEQAFAWLEKQKPHARFMAMAKTDARFDSLTRDPRFQALAGD
ncbi:MAG: tetratricopeptide repeat protein [Blastocatellia bacterium]